MVLCALNTARVLVHLGELHAVFWRVMGLVSRSIPDQVFSPTGKILTCLFGSARNVFVYRARCSASTSKMGREAGVFRSC